MKVKLDEDIPVSASQVLTEISHDVETVICEGLAGHDDATVLAAAIVRGHLVRVRRPL